MEWNPTTSEWDELDRHENPWGHYKAATQTPKISEHKPYRAYKPFDGVDPKRWPETHRTLMLFFYGGEWYSMTRDTDWDKWRNDDNHYYAG